MAEARDSIRMRMLGVALAALVPAVVLPWLVARSGGDPPSRAEWLAVGATAVAVLIVTAVLADRLVRRPLVALAHAAQKARRGLMAVRAPESGPVEMADMGRALNALVDEVAWTQSALETSLAEQAAETAALREELQNYASAVTHDLREPLLVLQLALRRIREQAGQAGVRDELLERRLDDAEAALASASRLVTGMMEDAGREGPTARDGAVDLESCLERALRDLDARIQESRARITSDILPEVVGSDAQVKLLLQNLIGNAIKYGGDPPEVQVRARSQDGMVRVEVIDNGQGVPAEERERIFLPFLRLGASAGDGVGLGLSMCRRVVEAHGGHIGVDEAPGGGALFWFTLPDAEQASRA